MKNKFLILYSLAFLFINNVFAFNLNDFKAPSYATEYDKKNRTVVFDNMIFGKGFDIVVNNEAIYIHPNIINASMNEDQTVLRLTKLVDLEQIKKDNPFFEMPKLSDMYQILTYKLADAELEYGCYYYKDFFKDNDNGKIDIQFKVITDNFNKYIGNIIISPAMCKNEKFNR